MMAHFLILLSGLPLSLGLTLGGAILGFILAILLTFFLSFYEKGIVRLFIQLFLIVFTGTPLLVQIFIIYYGPGQFASIRDSFLWPLLTQAWFCAVLALALNSAAYTTQLFYGAMKGIPKGLYEASRSLGLTRFETIRLIMPLALRRALPSYSNELVLVFKSTSLVCTITLMDVMGYAQYLKGQTYDSLTYYCLAGLIYLAVNSIMITVLRYIERKVTQFERNHE